MKNYLVWKILGVVPFIVVFSLWQLGGYSIWVFVIYSFIDWLFLRPALNIWRLRKLGVNDKFSLWQRFTLGYTHAKTLWGLGKSSN